MVSVVRRADLFFLAFAFTVFVGAVSRGLIVSRCSVVVEVFFAYQRVVPRSGLYVSTIRASRSLL